MITGDVTYPINGKRTVFPSFLCEGAKIRTRTTTTTTTVTTVTTTYFYNRIRTYSIQYTKKRDWFCILSSRCSECDSEINDSDNNNNNNNRQQQQQQQWQDVNNVPGNRHPFVLHAWDWTLVPWHWAPPLLRAGLLQVRMRVCVPPPHVTLQRSKSPQLDHAPLTEGNRESKEYEIYKRFSFVCVNMRWPHAPLTEGLLIIEKCEECLCALRYCRYSRDIGFLKSALLS